MRGWLAVGAAALLLAAALAIDAPAALVDGRVAELSEGRIRVAAAGGTVWRGFGELVILPDGVRVPIAWRLDPVALVRGTIAGSLTSADGERTAHFAITQNDFSIHDFSLALPAAGVLRAAGAPAYLGGAGGTLALDLAEFARQGDHLEARGDLHWKDASLTLPSARAPIALGEVHVAATGSGTEIPATLANSGGEVGLSGTLLMSGGGAVRVDARVTPRDGLSAERRQAIDALLSGIGRADGAGSYRVVWPLTIG